MPNPHGVIEISDDSDVASSYDGDDGELHGDKEAWLNALYETLTGIQTYRKIAASSRHTSFANPGIKIEGHPIISLPLTEEHAELIKAHCKQEASAQDDTQVRNSWELDAAQFEFTNPAWPSFLEGVMGEDSKELAFGRVSIKPQSLLLSGPGSLPKPTLPKPRRRDASKEEKRLIGTLLVCLPSRHHGGDIYLSYGDKKCAFSMDRASDIHLSTVTWFHDVNYEVEELISGYRLALTYSLMQKTPGQESAATVCGWAERLAELLGVWSSVYPNVPKLLYTLDNGLWDGGIAVGDLKGRDNAVCQTLYDVCSAAGCYFLLAQVTHEYDDQTLRENLSSQINSVYTPDGLRLPASQKFSAEREVLGLDLDDRDPDSDDDDGDWYMGGTEEGGGCRYHDTVALIMPKERLARFLNFGYYEAGYTPSSGRYFHRFDQTVINVMTMITQDLERYPNDVKTILAALDVMSRLATTPVPLNWPITEQIARWSLDSGEKEVYYKALAITPVDVAKVLGERLSSEYAGKEETVDWKEWLGPIAEENAQDFLAGCAQFKRGMAIGALSESLNAWERDMLDQKMEKPHPQHYWTLGDENFVLCRLQERSENIDWVVNRLLPSVASRGDRVFLFSLLHGISEHRHTPKFTHSRDMYRSIIQHSSGKLTIRFDDLAPPQRYGRKPRTLEPVYHQFLQFIEESGANGASEDAAEVLRVTSESLIEQQALWLRSCNPCDVVVRLITPLMKMFKRRQATPVPAVGKLLVILARTMKATIPPYPPKPEGWTHDRRGCGCPDCLELDRFLSSPNDESWRFTAAAARRQHVENVVTVHGDLFRLETLRIRNPLTLQVTKTGREHTVKVDHWEHDYLEVKDVVRRLESKFVQRFLGDEKYRSLILLEEFAEHAPSAVTDTARLTTIDAPSLTTAEAIVNTARAKRSVQMESPEAKRLRMLGGPP
ncbi:hypothetical protein ACJ41O_008619 [Fusarium nematophilum]